MKNKFNQSYTAHKAGDLIISEQPFAFVLSSKENGIRCDNCLNRYVFFFIQDNFLVFDYSLLHFFNQ